MITIKTLLTLFDGQLVLFRLVVNGRCIVDTDVVNANHIVDFSDWGKLKVSKGNIQLTAVRHNRVPNGVVPMLIVNVKA